MIQLGAKATVEQVVTKDMTASRIGSGALEVFGTPYMCAMMEKAAMTALQGFLDPERGSVGVSLDVTHDAPTPVGMKVWAQAEITGVSENGKIVTFAVSAWDETGPIGGGAHRRAIIHNARFLDKCNAKRE